MSNNILRKEQKKHISLYIGAYLLYLLTMIFLLMLVSYHCKISMFTNANEFYSLFTETIKYYYNKDIEYNSILTVYQLKIALKMLPKLYTLHLLVFFITLAVYANPKTNEWEGMENASGRFANEREKKRYIDHKNSIPVAHNVWIPIKTHIYKPHFYSRGIKQISPPNLNQLIIAGSGAGKSLREILPQIYSCVGNYVVVDPKSDLFKQSSLYMERQGYDVRVLNFFDILNSDRYNPMAYVHSEQDVLKLSELFMSATTNPDKRDYWTDSAKLIFSAIMLYLYNTPSEEKTIGRALRLVSSLSFGEQGGINQTSEYALLMTEYCNKEEHYQDMVYIKWQDIQSIPSQTLGGQISSLTTALQLFYTKDVQNLTSVDDLRLRDFADKDKKIILYVITPPADTTYKALITLFFSQLFTELQYECAKTEEGCLPVLLNVLMDEFANMSKIKDFDAFIAVCRSYNIRIAMVLQGYKQLKGKYKDEYSAIDSACAIFTALGSTDDDKDETLQYLCQKIGGLNIRTESRTYNFGGKSGGGSKNRSKIKREFQPNELKMYFNENKASAKRYGGDCLVFIGNEPPLAVHKYDTLHDATYLNNIGYKVGKQKKYLQNISDFISRKRENISYSPYCSNVLDQTTHVDVLRAEKEKELEIEEHERQEAMLQIFAETEDALKAESEQIGEFPPDDEFMEEIYFDEEGIDYDELMNL